MQKKKTKNIKEELIQITTNSACAGLIIKEGVCIETAPVLYKFRWQTKESIKRMCKIRKWKFEEVSKWQKLTKKRKRILM